MSAHHTLPLDYNDSLELEKGIYKVILSGAYIVKNSDFRISFKGPSEIYFIPKIKLNKKNRTMLFGSRLNIGTFLVKKSGSYLIKMHSGETIKAVKSSLPLSGLINNLVDSNQISMEKMAIKFYKTRAIVK